MAAFIDTTYVDVFVTQAVRVAVFTDSGVYNTAAFTQMVTTASQAVIEAAKNAGVTLGTTTTNETIKSATFGRFLIDFQARRGLELSDNMLAHVKVLRDIENGTIPLTDENPSGLETVGAAAFTSSDPDDITGISTGDVRPQVFRTLNTVY